MTSSNDTTPAAPGPSIGTTPAGDGLFRVRRAIGRVLLWFIEPTLRSGRASDAGFHRGGLLRSAQAGQPKFRDATVQLVPFQERASEEVDETNKLLRDLKEEIALLPRRLGR